MPRTAWRHFEILPPRCSIDFPWHTLFTVGGDGVRVLADIRVLLNGERPSNLQVGRKTMSSRTSTPSCRRIYTSFQYFDRTRPTWPTSIATNLRNRASGSGPTLHRSSRKDWRFRSVNTSKRLTINNCFSMRLNRSSNETSLQSLQPQTRQRRQTGTRRATRFLTHRGVMRAYRLSASPAASTTQVCRVDSS